MRLGLVSKIREVLPQVAICCEYSVRLPGADKIRIDIIVAFDDVLVPIELKRKLKSFGAEKDARIKMLGDIDKLANLKIEDLDLDALNYKIVE